MIALASASSLSVVTFTFSVPIVTVLRCTVKARGATDAPRSAARTAWFPARCCSWRTWPATAGSRGRVGDAVANPLEPAGRLAAVLVGLVAVRTAALLVPDPG